VIERAQQMLADHSVSAAFFVDVDSFKQINDVYGHAAGDQLLRIVASRLSAVVREEDVVGRLGGDEFVILLDASAGHAPPDVVAERLVQALHEPVSFEDGTVASVSASVGIAVGSRRTVDQLLRDADLALYAAKAAGRDRYMLYEAGMEEAGADADLPRVRGADATHAADAAPYGERRRTRA